MTDLTVSISDSQLEKLANTGFLTITLRLDGASHIADEAVRQGATYEGKRTGSSNYSGDVRREMHAAPQRNTGQPLPATEPQIKAIFAIARGARQMTPDDVKHLVADRYGVPVDSLSRRQASEFIDLLKSDGPIATPEPAAPARQNAIASGPGVDPDGLPF